MLRLPARIKMTLRNLNRNHEFGSEKTFAFGCFSQTNSLAGEITLSSVTSYNIDRSPGEELQAFFNCAQKNYINTSPLFHLRQLSLRHPGGIWFRTRPIMIRFIPSLNNHSLITVGCVLLLFGFVLL